MGADLERTTVRHGVDAGEEIGDVAAGDVACSLGNTHMARDLDFTLPLGFVLTLA
jgi:hypothetical protein